VTPTAELREALRALLAEEIPAGGSDADTRFRDAAIDGLLLAAATLTEAAAQGWLRKAAMALDDRGGLVESQVGSERLRFVGPEEFRAHALAMAGQFGEGAVALELAERDVLGLGR
jgi:hypothetical protein